MKTTRLIGCMCKRGNAFSLAVLIGRELDHIRLALISLPSASILYSVFRAQTVGADYGEGTPVSIPNTEVKLACADDTWLVTARDNKWCQHKYSSLAQLVEHAAVNRRVVGSSPTRGAKVGRSSQCGGFPFCSSKLPAQPEVPQKALKALVGI